ncbi:MAG TPA: aminotransferase class IV [Polyangia bacterium]|jgi:branched-chain amino acid aminotransferase
MSTRVHIGGQICPPDEAKISIFDRGFLYGDSVYETIGTMYGQLFALAAHLTRLERSAARLGLRVPPRAELERAVADTMRAAENAESRVRIILTRGVGQLDLDPASVDDTQLIVIVMPMQSPSRAMYDDGVSVAIVSVVRNDPRAIDPAIKSGNYLNNVLALGEARRQGAYEALLCGADGTVAEGASSNVFIIKGGEVRTPALDVGILDGITRAQVLALCRDHGIPARETHLTREDVRAGDESFITSATRAVLPVTRIDGVAVGDGRPGPVTRRLMQLLDQLARDGVA